MKNIIYIVLAFVIFSCKPKFDEIETTGGEVDFSRYVAIGNSLTAGYADGTLYKSGQENSYPSMLAEQFKTVNSGLVFTQPLMADDNGGFHFDPKGFPVKRVLGYATDCTGKSSLGPVLATSSAPNPANFNNIGASGPYQNMGVPGARVGHLLYSGYGNAAGLTTSPATANPYYVRFASSPNASILEDAMTSNPSFFTLWIGNNDVLLHATRGAADPSEPLTSFSDFKAAYEAVISRLVSGGAKGAIANIPDITSIPFFTTVGWNALDIDSYTADNLNIIFGNVADIASAKYGAAIGEQYRIKYRAGKNGFLMEVPKTASNPLGFRQLKEGEFIVLTVNQNAMKCSGYGSFNSARWGFSSNPDSLLVAVNPLKNYDVLDESEIYAIRTATTGFNSVIAEAASRHGLALVDMYSFMATIKDQGIMYDGVNYTPRFVLGGAFSLDGVHLTPRGYAIVANKFISTINSNFEAKIPQVSVNNFPGIAMP
ncbi:MAG: G-D-S-L family lipolytic protein [Flavobacteriales bacterium]|nr:G-D-S-L family lipolytic protein [Flavobacteriales bacterium]